MLELNYGCTFCFTPIEINSVKNKNLLTSSGALHHYMKTPQKHIGFLIEKLQFVDFSRIMNAIMELFRENNYEAQLRATREIQEERSPLI